MPNDELDTTVRIVTVLVISGTGSGVGKTVVSAALAALTLRRGARVAVLKAVQTGVTVSQPGDLARVRSLVGSLTTSELRRFPDSLSPEQAARRHGAAGITPGQVAHAAAELHQRHELVLLEGTAGLLARFDASGGTLPDVSWALSAPVILVADAGSDTVATTALSAEVATARGLDVAGVVIGRWPRDPGLVARCSVADLPVAAGAPLLGVLRDGLGDVSRDEFFMEADAGLSPVLGGTFDDESFATKLNSLPGP